MINFLFLLRSLTLVRKRIYCYVTECGGLHRYSVSRTTEVCICSLEKLMSKVKNGDATPSLKLSITRGKYWNASDENREELCRTQF